MQIGPPPISTPFNIVWLRRNLRLIDNMPLYHAACEDLPILILFVYDTDILTRLDDSSDLRVNFIHLTLHKLNKEASAHHGGVLTLHGTAIKVLEQIITNWPVRKIFHALDFEPYALARDAQVMKCARMNNVAMNSSLDHIIMHPERITTLDGKPYKVYTPYSKQWIKELKSVCLSDSQLPKSLNLINPKRSLLTLRQIGFSFKEWSFPDAFISQSIIGLYKDKRDFPSEEGTSHLGMHLRFGTISIRYLVKQALESNDNTFLKQLIWREFFIQVMFHFPNSMTQAFNPKYRNLPWRFDEEQFNRWKNGETGIPLVDAGMRQLNQTGYMHNRVRMIVASWLCKNLLFDWRLGERYFASKLLDFELASNVGSWQWVAGTGVDAAPYFRIFNPFTQAKKFDPNNLYIKKYIPNYSENTYPQPMVDYKVSRTVCLDFFRNNVSIT